MTDRRRRVLGAQNISRMCLVCGTGNVAGLHARFYALEAEAADAPPEGAVAGSRPSVDPELLGVFVPREVHQSYPGRLHGGIVSAMLDETIGRAVTIRHPGIWGVTAELTVRFLQPVPLDQEIRAVGRITRDTRRLFEGSGEVLLPDGTVAAEARGTYLKLPLEEIAPDGFEEREWFADPRDVPAFVRLGPEPTPSGE